MLNRELARASCGLPIFLPAFRLALSDFTAPSVISLTPADDYNVDTFDHWLVTSPVRGPMYTGLSGQRAPELVDSTRCPPR